MPDDYHVIEAKIKEALESVPEGIKPNFSNLARIYDVPRSRLAARYHGRNSRTTRDPTNMRLSKDQEIALCRYIDTFERVEIFPR